MYPIEDMDDFLQFRRQRANLVAINLLALAIFVPSPLKFTFANVSKFFLVKAFILSMVWNEIPEAQ
jgi:hypothetical protein